MPHFFVIETNFSLFKPRCYDLQPTDPIPYGTCRPRWIVFPPAGRDVSPQRVHPRHPPLQKSRGRPVLRGGDGAALLYRYERVRHGDDAAHETRIPSRDRAISSRQARKRAALYRPRLLVPVGAMAPVANDGVGGLSFHAAAGEPAGTIFHQEKVESKK